ncbi:DUF6678 family protein [Pontibacter indicus]|uniref:Uncharacterized protein n=1 Tax=Pontibacter indicus TaxID=1317125 RepID=A0A1R3WMJ8_9BACT|nr:DUF6678 family protein [Pontibacter indicus]SIT79350.1 hypothetical protein SAMN05444128_0736 [Pontibacter indicus]
MGNPKEVTATFLESQRLVPIMNQTKWRELIGAMCALPQLNPQVRIKYLQEDNPSGFAPIWWEQLEQTGLKNIEWLQIKAIQDISVGLLSPSLQTDYTDLIQEVLDRYSIPYTVEGDLFRITGYQRLQ